MQIVSVPVNIKKEKHVMKHDGKKWVHRAMKHLFKGKRDPFHERDATYSIGKN